MRTPVVSSISHRSMMMKIVKIIHRIFSPYEKVRKPIELIFVEKKNY